MHFISADVLNNCPSLGNFLLLHSGANFRKMWQKRSFLAAKVKWLGGLHTPRLPGFQGVMKKGTGCRKNSSSHEVMSGRRAAPIRQVVWRHVMDRKPPVLSTGWQMLMKQPDKRRGKAAWRDLWHSVEAACHSKHINNIYSAGVGRVATTSWLDLHCRGDSSDLGFYLPRAHSGRGSCGH